jgi:hypothetical protein
MTAGLAPATAAVTGPCSVWLSYVIEKAAGRRLPGLQEAGAVAENTANVHLLPPPPCNPLQEGQAVWFRVRATGTGGIRPPARGVSGKPNPDSSRLKLGVRSICGRNPPSFPTGA